MKALRHAQPIACATDALKKWFTGFGLGLLILLTIFVVLKSVHEPSGEAVSALRAFR